MIEVILLIHFDASLNSSAISSVSLTIHNFFILLSAFNAFFAYKVCLSDVIREVSGGSRLVK